MKKKKEALRLLEESLKELESKKGSTLTAIQKISRASSLLNNENMVMWCAIQLGDMNYIPSLEKYIKSLIEVSENTSLSSDEQRNKYSILEDKLIKNGFTKDIHFSLEEVSIKVDKSGGGYVNIGFIEEAYADLVRRKTGNAGGLYKNNLNKHISYVKKQAHEFASKLYNEVKFSDTVSNCFDILKIEIDDRLLDLNPEIAEQLMLAFKAVSSNKKEEWSHALTSCRRLLEGLADELFPASDEKVNGRVLKQTQYVNRLWAFMDKAIESDSNKDLAKAHIDLLGSWMEKTNKLTSKGVHASVTQIEATKTVFHTYLVIADILEYLEKDTNKDEKPNINTASLDDIEVLLDVSRTIAKEIYKVRVQDGYIDLDMLSKINGIGKKTLEKAQSVFIIDD